MSDVREILIPCSGCGHKTSTTVAQWSSGFPCESCGATVQRPKPGGAPAPAQAQEAPAPPVAPPTPVLKQAAPVSAGISMPTPGNRPPLTAVTDPDQPTATRSMQLLHAARRADGLAGDIQSLQQTNHSQQRSLDKLMEENRDLKMKLQRVSLERQSAELDATADVQRLKAENLVIREKFDELVKERVQLRSNLSILEGRCHRLEQDGGGSGGSAGSARQAAEATVLKKKVAELMATTKVIREKFDQIQVRYKESRTENTALRAQVEELESTGVGGGRGEQDATIRGLRLRLERAERKSEELENQNREMMDQTLKLEVEAGILNDKLSESRKENTILAAAATASRAAGDEIAQVRQEAQEAIDAAERKAASEADARTTLLLEVTTHRAQVEKLERELADSRDQEQQLDARLQEIHQREEKLSADLRVAEADLANLQDRLGAQEAGQTQDDLIEPEEMERLRKRLEELESDRAAIESAEKETDVQIDTIRVENQILREKLDEMIGEVVKQEAAPSADALVRLEIENKLLREKLDDLLGPVASPAADKAAADAKEDEAAEADSIKDAKSEKVDEEKKDSECEERMKSDADASEDDDDAVVLTPADTASDQSDDGKEDDNEDVLVLKPVSKAADEEPAEAKKIVKKKKALSPEAKRRQMLAKKLQKAKADAARKKADSEDA